TTVSVLVAALRPAVHTQQADGREAFLIGLLRLLLALDNQERNLRIVQHLDRVLREVGPIGRALLGLVLDAVRVLVVVGIPPTRPVRLQPVVVRPRAVLVAVAVADLKARTQLAAVLFPPQPLPDRLHLCHAGEATAEDPIIVQTGPKQILHVL